MTYVGIQDIASPLYNAKYQNSMSLVLTYSVSTYSWCKEDLIVRMVV